MSQHLDNDYVLEVMARLKKIPHDAKPLWGTLDRAGLVEHFIWVVRHSMGRSKTVPFVGNWASRWILRPLILNGIVSIPKNIAFPRWLRETGFNGRERGDEETLHALLEEYLNLVQADELVPGLHPAFGNIGIDGWDRLHVLHFEHHFKQFGV
jgi:hypothetical protein